MSTVSSPRDQPQQAEGRGSNRESGILSPTSEKSDTENTDKATAELSIVVDELLNQLSTKFAGISEELLSKMDDMSRRLDSLEASIQAGKSAAPEK